MSNPHDKDKPTTIVIFGASGDLTQRKLIPALFSLHRKKRVPRGLNIIGAARTEQDDNGFREEVQEGVKKFAEYHFSEDEWNDFADHLHYCAGDFTKDDAEKQLKPVIEKLEGGPANRLYYLATPPQFFAGIISALARAGMVDQHDGFRRVIIEKPFGTDLKSARALNEELHQLVSEQQIYRIDHYLGKETVQNVLIFRFANGIFEPIWNRNYIDHVQISVLEEVGVGHRAGYYDTAGVLRDMFQNHLLQLLALVAMEPPASFNSNAIRNERAKVLSAVRPMHDFKTETVRGQYKGYRQEEGIKPDSQTPTYSALRFTIDNWRWQDVPFYLRSGKSLKEKRTEVVIQFKCPPHLMFPSSKDHHMTPNMLALCLQPDEGIHLRFEAKVPDTSADMRSVDMDFNYEESFGSRSIPEAYERLLLDAIHGDAALFIRSDQIEYSWELIDPILKAWDSTDAPPLALYDPGTWGPTEADEFVDRDGRCWLMGCGDRSKEKGALSPVAEK